MSDLHERFTYALHNTARAWRQGLDRRLKYLGVSQASWLTIAAAARSRWPLSQSELADRLAVEGATMVAMIDRLVKSGLVVREPSTTDRRIKRIVLTEAGNQLYEKVRSEAEAFRHELLVGIDRSRVEAATLLLEELHGLLESPLP